LRSPVRRFAFTVVALGVITVGAPLVSATADPKPGNKQLAAQVEDLYNQIEQLTEQYNGEQVRLREATRAADLAKKTLSRSEGELELRRQRATLFAQNSYMTGGVGSPLMLFDSVDPSTYLDEAATTYALQMQEGEEVLQVAEAMKTAERARTSAKARQDEVTKLINTIDDRVSKIRKLVKKTESNLYKSVAANVAVPKRLSFPVIGDGKAAEAARWALTQQLKPYVWGGAGPSSFDCSGLIMVAYQHVGISLPHFTGDLWTSGTHVSRADLRPGDLVFFYSDLHHVGLYIGGGYMIHAPHTGDVVRIAPLGNRPFAGGVRIAD